MKSKISISRAIFAISIFVYLLLNIFTLKNGHNWGDDFAQYILHAQNIVQGRPYSADIMLESWAVVLPGYPLILVPFIYYFGVNFKVLKLLNVFFWLGTVVAAYPLIKPRVGREIALLVCVLSLFLTKFFMFKQNVLSDIPFTFFCMVSLCHFRNLEVHKQGAGRIGDRWLYFLGVLAMGLACLIRYPGVALLLGLIFYLWVTRNAWKSSILLLGYIGLIYLVQSAFDVKYFEKIDLNFVELCSIVLMNVKAVFSMSYDFFVPYLGLLWPALDKALRLMVSSAAPFILAWILLSAALRIKGRAIPLWECFGLIYLLMIIAWPKLDARYIFPVAIFILVWEIDAVLTAGKFLSGLVKRKFSLEKCVRILLIVALTVNVFFTYLFFNFNDDMILQPQVKEMTRWVKTNTKRDDNFMFHKPRALNLLTGRVGTTMWIGSQDKPWVAQRIKRYGINYIIAVKKVDLDLIEGLDASQVSVRAVWENKHYRIYKVN